MILKCIDKEITLDTIKQMNALSLAFIGDAVFDVVVREYVIKNNPILSAHKLHLKTIEYVKAQGQSKILKKIESYLNEEEVMIFKRGRNTKSATVPKNANVQDYRTATGLETLIGYLYLTDNGDRLKELIKIIFE